MSEFGGSWKHTKITQYALEAVRVFGMLKLDTTRKTKKFSPFTGALLSYLFLQNFKNLFKRFGSKLIFNIEL